MLPNLDEVRTILTEFLIKCGYGKPLSKLQVRTQIFGNKLTIRSILPPEVREIVFSDMNGTFIKSDGKKQHTWAK